MESDVKRVHGNQGAVEQLLDILSLRTVRRMLLLTPSFYCSRPSLKSAGVDVKGGLRRLLQAEQMCCTLISGTVREIQNEIVCTCGFSEARRVLQFPEYR